VTHRSELALPRSAAERRHRARGRPSTNSCQRTRASHSVREDQQRWSEPREKHGLTGKMAGGCKASIRARRSTEGRSCKVVQPHGTFASAFLVPFFKPKRWPAMEHRPASRLARPAVPDLKGNKGEQK